MTAEVADLFLRNVSHLAITPLVDRQGYILSTPGETVSLPQARNFEFRPRGAVRISHLYFGAEDTSSQPGFNIAFDEACQIRLQKGTRCYLYIAPSG